ncbi:MAG: helix-turn-helix domain-containing protein [Acidiferrobacterales bacterium]
MNTTKSRERLGVRYLTVPEIADRWQCSKRHVRRVIASSRLTAHRFGRLVRVTEADLEAYERINRAD